LVLRSHFAVGRFLGCVVFLRRVALTTLSDRYTLSSSSAFLQSLAQRNLVSQPQPANTSHGLSFPSAHEGSEVHSTRALPAHYVPPSGFAYPLDGLLPPSPCRLSFAPAALMGFTLRSFLLLKGIHTFPHGRTHMPFQPSVFPTRRSGLGRPNGLRLLGFDPSRSPSRPDAGLVRPPLDAPLGFALLGHPGDDLAQESTQTPPARLAQTTLRRKHHASEYQSVLAWPQPAFSKPNARSEQPF